MSTKNGVHTNPEVLRTDHETSTSKETVYPTDKTLDDLENPVRGNWPNRIEFLLASLGYVVGTENLLKFPYLCAKHGGAAFLIPYFVAMFTIGLPILFMEFAIGQFTSLGCIGVWRCVPMFTGIGWAMIITSAIMTIYQSLSLCYAVLYFVASFTDLPGLPWVGCGNEWNTEQCFDHRDLNVTADQIAERWIPAPNDTTSASEEYFKNFILDLSSGIDDDGYIGWRLALSLFFVWILVYLCIIRGIKSIGKVAYFTTALPCVALTVLLLRGSVLQGARDGLEYYLGKAEFHKLEQPEVWGDAARHVIYSLNLATGGLYTLASYNKFHHHIFQDSIIITLASCMTSLVAGCVVFSYIGNLAHELGVTVADIVDGGSDLAFAVMPDAFSRLPTSPAWAVLFFLAIIALSIDSLFVNVETIITGVLDVFRSLGEKRCLMQWILPVILCTAVFLLTFPHASQAGYYWLVLMETSSVVWLGFVLLFASLVVANFYGIRRFQSDIKHLLVADDHGRWFLVTLYILVLIPMVVAPAIFMIIIVLYCISHEEPTVGNQTYPAWAVDIGWLITLAPLVAIVIYAPYYMICRTRGSFVMRFVRSMRPTPRWGPALREFRYESRYRPMPAAKENDGRPGESYPYPNNEDKEVQCDLGEI